MTSGTNAAIVAIRRLTENLRQEEVPVLQREESSVSTSPYEERRKSESSEMGAGSTHSRRSAGSTHSRRKEETNNKKQEEMKRHSSRPSSSVTKAVSGFMRQLETEVDDNPDEIERHENALTC